MQDVSLSRLPKQSKASHIPSTAAEDVSIVNMSTTHAANAPENPIPAPAIPEAQDAVLQTHPNAESKQAQKTMSRLPLRNLLGWMKRKSGHDPVDSRDHGQGGAGTRGGRGLPDEGFMRRILDKLIKERDKELDILREQVVFHHLAAERARLQERRAGLFEGAHLLYDDRAESAFTVAFAQISAWSGRYLFDSPTVDDATCKLQAEKAAEVLPRHFFRTETAEELFGILRDGRLRFALATDLAVRFLCLQVYRSFGIDETPAERGLDFWLDEDLRSSFAKLENNIHQKVDNARREFEDQWLPELQTITRRQYNDWRAITATFLSKGQHEVLSRQDPQADHEDRVLREWADRIEEIFAPWDNRKEKNGYATLMKIVAKHVSFSRLLRRQRARLSVIYPGMPVVPGSPVEVITFNHTTMRDLYDRLEEDRPDLIVRFLERPTLSRLGTGSGSGFEAKDLVLARALATFDWLPDTKETELAGHGTA